MRKNENIKGRLLYILSPEKGLLFKNLAFYTVNLRTARKEKLASVVAGKSIRILSRLRLANRLMRLEPKCVGRLSDDIFVFVMFGKLYSLDIRSKTLCLTRNLRSGFSVLNFCEYNGCLYFGDYGVNKSYESINIYRLSADKNVTIAYTFKPEQIRHIHNIVNDTKTGRLWIFAGDNEPEAGIYYTDDEFKTVRRMAVGQQAFRTVVAFPHERELVYATDSVEKTNYIYKLYDTGKIDEICEINGSCIYGTETRNHYIFSTTVESAEGQGIRALLSRKLGGGIKSREVHIIAVDKKTLSAEVVARFEKDCWPMKLLQYGRTTFPGGQKDLDYVWTYVVACKKMDGQSLKIDLK